MSSGRWEGPESFDDFSDDKLRGAEEFLIEALSVTERLAAEERRISEEHRAKWPARDQTIRRCSSRSGIARRQGSRPSYSRGE
jgi:hypothetical protein